VIKESMADNGYDDLMCKQVYSPKQGKI